MPDRIARVVLQAVVTQYRDAMRSASKDTAELSKQVQVSTAKQNQAMETLGRGMLVGGAVVVAGMGAAVMASKRFEKELSNVKAVSNATAGEMHQLSEAALKAGADTAFSAAEAAQAEAELAKAGVSVSDILGGALTGALSLAAAGQLDLAQAATVSAQAMNIFKLEGSDVAHIADVLAAGANKSAADVKDFGDALRQGGLVASQTGLSLEETTGALAAFADNALIGSDAGTSLKTMLQRLTPQSKEAEAKMAELGISAYDARGEFIGLEKFAGVLRTGLSNLTDEQKNSALATIFGSDAVRAAAILYDQGAEGIREYVEAVNDQGAAARMAATQLDNLDGDVEALGGSLETVLIKNGSGANKVLRELTQGATGMVNAFGSLPTPVQQGATGLVALTGAAVATAGAVTLGVGQVRKFREAMDTLGVSSERTGRMVRGAGMVAKGAGYAGAALALAELIETINTAGARSAPSLDKLTASLVDFAQTGALTGAMTRAVGKDFSDLGEKIEHSKLSSGALDWLSGGGKLSWTVGGKTVKEAKQDLDALDKTLASLVTSGHADVAATAFRQLSEAAQAQGVNTKDLNSTFNEYQDAITGADTKTRLATGATSGLAGKTQELTEASQAAADALRNQANAAKAMFDPVFAAQDALLNHAKAQQAVNQALRQHGARSVEYQEAQREALRATVEVQGAVLNLKAGLQDGTVSLSQMNAQIDAYARAGLISASQARHFKGELAAATSKSDALTSSLGVLNAQRPRPVVQVAGVDPTLNSLRAIERKMQEVNGMRARIVVQAVMTGQTSLRAAERQLGIGAKPPGKAATGGYITGPGTGTSDSIDMRVSNGEYVINADSTRQHRPLLDMINSGARFVPASTLAGGMSGGRSITFQGGINVQQAVREEPASTLPAELSKLTWLLS